MTAEELLMSEESETFEYSNVITIDGPSKVINIPLGEERFGVEGDKGVALKHFSCPRIVGNNIEIDLALHNLYANYTLADEKGNPKSKDVLQTPCENIVVNGDTITFDWKISEWVTREDGYIAFSIVAKQSIDGVLNTRWYTTPAVGQVLRTVKEGSYLEQQYPDVIDNLMNRVAELEKSIGSGGTAITVDSELSLESENPVQNKVITAEFGRLSEEITGNLQNGIDAANERVILLETMVLNNEFAAPMITDDDTLTVITDDNGNAILADWKYKEV